MHRVLNVAVPEIVLNEAGIRALVGEGKAACMAQHLGMNGNGELGLLAVLVQHQVDGRAVQGLALLTEEERPPCGKNDRPVGFMRARCTSQALMARISSPCSG
jgi:hypothetical protein